MNCNYTWLCNVLCEIPFKDVPLPLIGGRITVPIKGSCPSANSAKQYNQSNWYLGTHRRTEGESAGCKPPSKNASAPHRIKSHAHSKKRSSCRWKDHHTNQRFFSVSKGGLTLFSLRIMRRPPVRGPGLGGKIGPHSQYTVMDKSKWTAEKK